MITFDEGGVRLLTVSDIDEMRTVSMVPSGDGALVVVEQTDGELTYETFGVLSQQRLARIEEGSLGTLVRALGGAGGVRETLERFFSHDDVFLSDLLDVMDAAGIPYHFATSADATTLVRMG